MNSPGDITPDEVQSLFERLKKEAEASATISTLTAISQESSARAHRKPEEIRLWVMPMQAVRGRQMEGPRHYLPL